MTLAVILVVVLPRDHPGGLNALATIPVPTVALP